METQALAFKDEFNYDITVNGKKCKSARCGLKK
jgi:hypothetical protein